MPDPKPTAYENKKDLFELLTGSKFATGTKQGSVDFVQKNRLIGKRNVDQVEEEKRPDSKR